MKAALYKQGVTSLTPSVNNLRHASHIDTTNFIDTDQFTTEDDDIHLRPSLLNPDIV